MSQVFFFYTLSNGNALRPIYLRTSTDQNKETEKDIIPLPSSFPFNTLKLTWAHRHSTTNLLMSSIEKPFNSRLIRSNMTNDENLLRLND